MTTAETIHRALTSEEWAEVLRNRGQFVGGQDSTLPRIAALALYGQPFGFTHEDVTLLRGIARNHGLGFTVGDGPQPPERVRALADRIAALLPPE
jgi:hypothetical protein